MAAPCWSIFEKLLLPVSVQSLSATNQPRSVAIPCHTGGGRGLRPATFRNFRNFAIFPQSLFASIQLVLLGRNPPPVQGGGGFTMGEIRWEDFAVKKGGESFP